MTEKLLERFIEYVQIDTQSDENSETTPSTKRQFDLAKKLYAQLDDLDMDYLELDESCYLYAHLHSNIPGSTQTQSKHPKIGLIAHLDTAPATTGKSVNPKVIKNYNGNDIKINNSLTLTIKENPNLVKSIGHTLVTTDGSTLLGADDKAGIAIIMSLIDYFKQHPEVTHPDIRIAFTPDEEIGRGAAYFDLKKFDADVAYTVDGGFEGEINKETFSADSAFIEITGKNIHPGEAKNVMINALKVAADIISNLPREMAPETTEKREPFIHVNTFTGDIAKARIHLLLRSFDAHDLKNQKNILEQIIGRVKKNYPGVKISLEISQTYRNMREGLELVPLATDHLETAVIQAGIKPEWIPIRGGTDGSGLTARGLPCPNIFTGGNNYHGPMEWVSVDVMEKSVQTLINLMRIWINEA